MRVHPKKKVYISYRKDYKWLEKINYRVKFFFWVELHQISNVTNSEQPCTIRKIGILYKNYVYKNHSFTWRTIVCITNTKIFRFPLLTFYLPIIIWAAKIHNKQPPTANINILQKSCETYAIGLVKKSLYWQYKFIIHFI